MQTSGYIGLLESLSRSPQGAAAVGELHRLAGEHPAGHLLGMAERTLRLENPDALWTHLLVDRSIPLPERAAALTLGMEPCAHGVSGLPTLICYSWEQTFIGLIEWEALDPELHELAFALLMANWHPRKVEAQPHRSPGTGKPCIKGEYRSLSKPLLWAVKRWKNEKPERMRALFDRLPIDQHSARDVDPIWEFGEMIRALEDDRELLGAFFSSCGSTVRSLGGAQGGDKGMAEFTLAAIVNGLPEQFVGIGKEALAKLLLRHQLIWDIASLWQLPGGYAWPGHAVPGKGVFAFIGLLEEISEEYASEKGAEHIKVALRLSTSSSRPEEKLTWGVAQIIDYTVVRTLELLAHWKREERNLDGIEYFIDVHSPLARRGIDALVAQEGLRSGEGRWADMATPHLARTLRDHYIDT